MKDPTLISTEELKNHDYRFVVRRNSPKPTGWRGTFYGEDVIACSGSIESCVLYYFGGGRYSIKVYKDSIPQPGVIRVIIDGPPKEAEKESEIEELMLRAKELQSYFENKHEEYSELEAKTGNPNFKEFIQVFSDMIAPPENKDWEGLAETIFSEIRSLSKEIVKEFKTRKEPQFENIAEVKDAVEKNQSKINAMNLHLIQQESKINQFSKAFESLVLDIKGKESDQRREIYKISRQLREVRNQSIDLNELLKVGVLGFAVFYGISPDFRKSVDQKVDDFFSSSKPSTAN